MKLEQVIRELESLKDAIEPSGNAENYFATNVLKTAHDAVETAIDFISAHKDEKRFTEGQIKRAAIMFLLYDLKLEQAGSGDVAKLVERVTAERNKNADL